jgi:hypothetical protein
LRHAQPKKTDGALTRFGALKKKVASHIKDPVGMNENLTLC